MQRREFTPTHLLTFSEEPGITQTFSVQEIGHCEGEGFWTSYHTREDIEGGARKSGTFQIQPNGERTWGHIPHDFKLRRIAGGAQ